MYTFKYPKKCRRNNGNSARVISDIKGNSALDLDMVGVSLKQAGEAQSITNKYQPPKKKSAQKKWLLKSNNILRVTSITTIPYLLNS